MHSSRMRTGHSLTVCRSLLPEGGDVCSGEWGDVCSGGCLLWEGVCLGVSALGGVSAPGGVCSGGCLLWGVCLWGVCSGGVSTLGGVCSGGIPACSAEADTPPPCEQNDKQVQKYYLDHNFVPAGNSFVAFKLHRKDSVDYLTLVRQEWILLSDKLIVNSLARMDKQKY